MPFKKYKPRTTKYKKRKFAYRKKRMYHKNKNGKGFSLTVKTPASQKTPFPQRFKTKLFLEAQGIIPSGATIPTDHYLVYGNNPFAPFSTGASFRLPNMVQSTGMSPIGLDQLLIGNPIVSPTGSWGIYDACTVHASKVQWEFQVIDNKDDIQITAFPLPTTSGASYDVGSSYQGEQPYSKTINLNQSKVNKISQYHTTRKLYGLTKQQFSNVNATIGLAGSLAGSFSIGRSNSSVINPQNPWYHCINVKSSNPSASITTNNISYTCRVWFYCEFFNLTLGNIAVIR